MYELSSDVRDSLRVFLTFHDMKVDLDGLVRDMALDADSAATEALRLILDRLGFKTRVKKVKSPRLGRIDIPAFLWLQNDKNDGGVVGLYMPQKTHGNCLYVAQDTGGLRRDDGFDPKKYSGLVLEVYGHEGATAHKTAHMKQGHALDWFWMPIVYYWSRYSEIFLSSIFINLMVLVIPFYTLNIYDRVVINFSEETLIVLTVGVLMALSFDLIFKTIRSYLLERVAEDTGAQYDYDLMERLFRVKRDDIPLSLGEKVNIFREMQGIREFYAGRFIPTLIDIPFVMLFIFVVHQLCPPLALVPLTICGIVFFVNLVVNIPIKRITEKYFVSNQHKFSQLVETLAGMQTSKMFNATGSQLLKWDITVKSANAISRRNFFLVGLASNISMFLSQSAHILVVFFGVYQIEQQNLTIGGLIACSILSARAISPVMGMTGVLSRLKQSNDVLKVIDGFFKLEYEDREAALKSPKGPFKGEVTLSEVAHQYAGQDRPALQGVSLTLKPGEHVGIIGKTAAGKSTLSKIIAAYMEPTLGEVLLDGYKYGAIPHGELRDTIAYVPQEPFFFKGSIRQNILLGREFIPEDHINRAVTVSGLDIVLKQTSEGMDMDVGEHGSHLSGGQRQAISLARALVQNPRVIVFDEPTNGMDTALEQRVSQQLLPYIEGRTFVMVTHRTGLLSLVKRLILIDNGKVVADGPRDEILERLNGSKTD